MTFLQRKITAVVFDLGNTLIEFGPKQFASHNTALNETLLRLFGECDVSRLEAIRERQIMTPFVNGYRENNLRTVCEELIQGLYGIVAEETQIDALVRTRYEAFIKAVKLPAGVLPLLKKLHKRYRLGLVSNYPCARSILDSLKKIGLAEIFETTVISGEVGYIKPHPKPFEVLLSRMGLSPSECVHVGDNWLADVQGAKRMGMFAILTTQYVPYEKFEPYEADHNPDARISHLNELEKLLLT